MNTTHAIGRERGDMFLGLVDFKWLMAGVGWWVSLSRLQSDKRYIRECLQRALGSDSELLRERSIELLRLLPAPDVYAGRAADAAAVPEHRTLVGNKQ